MILSLAFDLREPAALARLGAAAERAGIDLLLAGYPPGGLAAGVLAATPALDPLSVASALAGLTGSIGLGAVVATSGWAPFNVARAFSALDHMSAGRAAWFVLPGEDDAADPGRERHREHLDVTFALLDSWDPDALVFDKPNALFADPSKVHRIAHAGRCYTVDGPLNSPRSPQGRPVLIQAVEYATADADILIVRTPEPFPLEGEGKAKILVDLAFSLTGALFTLDAPALSYAGDPDGLATLMQAWLAAGACDGFNLLPANLPDDAEAFADHAAPILRAAGLHPDSPPGLLRDRLGLGR